MLLNHVRTENVRTVESLRKGVRRHLLLAGMWAVICCLPAYGQEAVVCTEALAQAQEAYSLGRFQEAVDAAFACLQRGNPAPEEHQQALLMQARSDFILGRKEDAVAILQSFFSSYPDEVLDHEAELPIFLELAEEVRRGLHRVTVVDTTELLATASTESIPVPTAFDGPNTDPMIPLPTEGLFEVGEVDVVPVPEGGRGAILSRLEYPAQARANGTEGYVVVGMAVDRHGRVRNAEVVRGLEDGCNEAALDVLRQTRFVPGQKEGQIVPVKMMILVPFFLDEH